MKYFELHANGEIFNSLDFDIFVGSIERSLMPSIEFDTEKLGTASGVYVGNRTFEPLEIAINCEMTTNNEIDYEQKRQVISYFLTKYEQYELFFPSLQDKFYKVRVKGETNVSREGNIYLFTILLFCHKPFLYSVNEKEYDFTDRIEVTNNGTYETFPIFEVTASTTYIKIFNETTNKHILLTDLKPAQKVRIYTERNLILDMEYGYRLNKHIDLSSDLFPLTAGVNRLRIEPVGDNIKIKYVERFI